MRDSRANICAALQSVGGQNLETLADETLARARVGPGADPRRIVLGINYDLRSLTHGSLRAVVFGRVIGVRWDADEWALNAFIGVARAVFPHGSHADIFRLTGHLAMPGLDRFEQAPPSLYLPAWFMQAHRRRTWAQHGSGVWQAVRRIAR